MIVGKPTTEVLRVVILFKVVHFFLCTAGTVL